MIVVATFQRPRFIPSIPVYLSQSCLLGKNNHSDATHSEMGFCYSSTITVALILVIVNMSTPAWGFASGRNICDIAINVVLIQFQMYKLARVIDCAI